MHTMTLVQWLSGLLKGAAWPGLVVLVSHSVLGYVFGHEPYIDPALHFLGGVAAAFFCSRLEPYFPAVFGALAPATRRTLAFTATTTIAVLWEFMEFLFDVYLGTHAHTSIRSTLRDILNGMLGAGVYLLAEYVTARFAVRAGDARN
jgi:hypothetical protein